MNSTTAHPKKSPSSLSRRNRPVLCGEVEALSRGVVCHLAPKRSNARALHRTAFRAWRVSLPTALERDTLLMPDAVAESVVQEVERFLQSELPANFAERLAAKAHYLYPRHKHFHKMLNRPGNFGRHNLYVYMRHWTAGWLKRDRYALYKRLPWSFGMGRQLPVLHSQPLRQIL
jgi:hypothetical protein